MAVPPSLTTELFQEKFLLPNEEQDDSSRLNKLRLRSKRVLESHPAPPTTQPEANSPARGGRQTPHPRLPPSLVVHKTSRDATRGFNPFTSQKGKIRRMGRVGGSVPSRLDAT